MGGACRTLPTNGGFNDGDAFNGDLSSQVGWDFINDTFAVEDLNVFRDFGPVSHDGDGQSVKMFEHEALAIQAIAATPGVAYTASALAMSWTGNGITDPFGELGFMELSFLNAGGDTIGFATVVVDPIDDGVNTYRVNCLRSG